MAQFIRENHLVPAAGQLVVAVSGGADSVCLLHTLFKLREELNLTLHIAHLDHRLRGAESEADARYVARLADRLGLPVTIGASDVRTYRAKRRISLEEAAREVRYDFLSQVAESIGASCIAVGHTSDDQVETILMHLIRGTGIRGLRGLQASSQWRSSGHQLTIIRPLLPLSRQETAEYCRIHRLEPRLDSSNLSLSPLRNKVRQQLIPLLSSYNPRVKEALLRMARLADDDLTSLEESSRLWSGLIQRQGKTIILDRQGFLDLTVSLKRRLLREAIGELLGSLKDIEARHINGIIAAAGKQAGKRLSLPGGLAFVIDYDRFLLAPESAVSVPLPAIKDKFVIKIPGETRREGWQIKAAIIRPSEMMNTGNAFTAYLSLDNIGDKLIVRSRRPGDRFQPLGMSQPKELAEFMIDAKIPRIWRPRVPIVCSPQHIVWVVGWRIDERAKVTEDTKQILCLEFSQTQAEQLKAGVDLLQKMT